MKPAGLASSFGLLALLASACEHVAQAPEPYRQPSATTNSSLLGTWELVSVDGLAVKPKAVNVTFDRTGAFTAMVDCNTAQGHYSFSGVQLSFVGWSATERGCEAPLEQEKLIVTALVGDGYAVALTKSELHLSGPHEVIFRRV